MPRRTPTQGARRALDWRPSEARSTIIQATGGCSRNHCTYGDMYRQKSFRLKPLGESLLDIRLAQSRMGPYVHKVFVADGDALVMDMGHWEPILVACARSSPRLRQVSCSATATNVLAKTPEELRRLRELGLSLLYMGPESGDEVTLKRLAKQPRPRDASGAAATVYGCHVEAARRAREAGMRVSAIFLLGAGGTARSDAHAEESARLVTDMDPDSGAALTLKVISGTPLWKDRERHGRELPDTAGLLSELRALVDLARPTDAVFRTNHASNYLPLGGRLPRDREAIVAAIDTALAGAIPLRPEWSRGL